MAMPNRKSSPTYRRATPFTRLRKENSFGEYVKEYLCNFNTQPYIFETIYIDLCVSRYHVA
ncbi:hypothetical protein B1R38_00480 [Bacillus cereus]|uniref:Uncharacterized protein n=1 Tax=Bacillus cereus TaxID=1396 RepID=A0A9X6SVR8_BACCE|nr:hypothetical protein CON36_25885 [Bacillus cereus]PEU52171.1 hypothetical protein CN405_27860 [Bacillus cereus]PEY40996.1 hypothetical protein CN347_01380 [Bacillus cereus]PFJ28702.1 hypothetical protein COI90_24135 [Bacillus cereus]PFJ78298.1 hypothetical protein COJ08_07535 [Bacillus cereus]